MKENLRTRLYNDGTEILFDATVGSVGSSPTWQNLTVGGHTIYAHDNTASPSNLTTYVYLYNWYEAAGIVTNWEVHLKTSAQQAGTFQMTKRGQL